MKFKRIEVSSENKVVVKDNNISLYLEMDISEIYDKIEVIMAIVETKD